MLMKGGDFQPYPYNPAHILLSFPNHSDLILDFCISPPGELQKQKINTLKSSPFSPGSTTGKKLDLIWISLFGQQDLEGLLVCDPGCFFHVSRAPLFLPLKGFLQPE